jgi:PAS domain S-box-containing protein
MNNDVRKRILLAEDEALVAAAEKADLEEYGYDVIIVNNGEKAVQTILGGNEKIDLILMDIDLGDGIDGTQAAEQILNFKEIPIVFLSSHTEKEIVEKTEKITSYGYIVKNSGITVLDASIKMAFKLFSAKQETGRELDQRKRSENELFESRERLASTLKSIGDGVIACDLKGQVQSLNKVAEKLTGWTENEAAGRPIEEVFNIINGDDRKRVENPVHTALKEAVTVELSNNRQLVSRGGEERQIADTCSPIRDFSGQIIGAVLVFRDVSEEYSMKRSIEQSEELLSGVFNSIQDGLSILDKNLNIRKVNRVMQEWYAANVPLTGKKCYKCYHNSEKPCDICPTLRSMKSGKTESNYVKGLPGSSIEWIELFAYPMRDIKSGEIYGVVEFVRDVTEKKQTEDALRFSEAKYRSLFENVLEGIFQTTPEGKILSANRFFANMCGFDSPQELIEAYTNIGEQLYANPEDRKIFRLKLEAEGSLRNFETRIVKKDGNLIWVSANVRAVKDDSGAVRLYEGTITDITERRMTEEQLEKTKETYLGLFNSLTEAVYIQDKNGTFLEVNEGALKLYGLSRQELTGKDPSVVAAPGMNNLEEVAGKIENTFKTGTPSQFEFWAVRKNGEIFLKDVIVSKGKYFGEDVIIATARDITIQKQTEQSLHEQKLYQQILLDMAANFINLPIGEFDWAVNEMLEKAGRFIKADRVYLFMYDYSSRTACNTHEWCAEGITSEKDSLQQVDFDVLSSIINPLFRGEAVHIADINELKTENGLRQHFEQQGVKSLAVIPLMQKTYNIGFAGFDSVKEKRIFTGRDLDILKVLTEILSNAFARKEIENALYEEEKRAVLQRGAVSDIALDPNFISGEIDQCFSNITAKTAQTLDVSWVSIWMFSDDKKELHCRSYFDTEQKIHKSGMILKADEFPQYFEAILSENIILTEDAANDRRTEKIAEKDLKAGRIISMLDCGIILHGEPAGVVCCTHTGERRKWHSDEESFISTISAMISQLYSNNERRHAESVIQRQLNEKEIFLKEVHHRIKNNITSIRGMLRLQASAVSNAEAKSIINDAVNRVESMNQVYDKLLLTDDYRELSVKQYLEDLVKSIVQIFPENRKIDLAVNICDFYLNARTLVPVGIIINEIVTNSFKHAFTEKSSGKISVLLSAENNKILLSVQDDGKGLPEDFDINSSEGFGAMLIKSYADYLDANIRVESGNGTKYYIDFTSNIR